MPTDTDAQTPDATTPLSELICGVVQETIQGRMLICVARPHPTSATNGAGHYFVFRRGDATSEAELLEELRHDHPATFARVGTNGTKRID